MRNRDTRVSESLPDSDNPIPPIPRPPSPCADTGILASNGDHTPDPLLVPSLDTVDVFVLEPLAALKLLCDFIENLVSITGDIPPTPPISQPSAPQPGIIGVRKENVQRHRGEGGHIHSSPGAEDDDGVPARAKTPIGSPEAHPTEPLHVVGANMEPLNVQHGAIARKFYSKKPPPISLEEYLLRLHKFCPMSTAVYLATSLYIHRLAVIERIIPVTSRNVHRLVLAGLRVAMKALEDCSYPHRRFAKVGGVSEPELGRLEVSFCFVTNFELKVDEEMLSQHAKALGDGVALHQVPLGFKPQTPSPKDKRAIVVGQTRPPTMATSEAPAAA